MWRGRKVEVEAIVVWETHASIHPSLQPCIALFVIFYLTSARSTGSYRVPRTQNLIAAEAVSKLRDIVKGSPTCMFATNLEQAPFHVVPMRVQEADYEGNLWFFSSLDSTHATHIHQDPRVQLIFSNSPGMEFMTVFGNASITTEKTQIDRLWDEMVSSWFGGERENPRVCLIKVQPAVAHYWDSEDGKLITIAKMLTQAVTGSPIGRGVEGNLRL